MIYSARTRRVKHSVAMSEFGFINGIKNLFAELPSNGFDGIGDDCAVLPDGNGGALVFTTDLLAEDVHFLRAATSAEMLGRKALAVNLSDVAAMGAEPVASMLSISLPADATGEWADGFMRGYREMSGEWNIPLVGGDTTASKSGITINVVAVGRVREENVKRRSAARAGDAVMVGGVLGASAEGLRDILRGEYDTPNALIHKNPMPQVREGIWLGGRREVHAMMDISDGIASDLVHILEASRVGAVINTELVPAVSDIRTAVCGGEDYKLLFTVDGAAAERLAADFLETFGYAPYVIGRIVGASDYTVEWRADGRRIATDWQGFTHY